MCPPTYRTTKKCSCCGGKPNQFIRTSSNHMEGWWTCGKCKDDVKCYQEDWEDNNQDDDNQDDDQRVSQICNSWGTLKLITTEDTVKVFIPKNSQLVAEMKRSDYDFFMNPMEELEDHFPLPRHFTLLKCDKCGYPDIEENERKELLQSRNYIYHPTGPNVFCYPVSGYLAGPEFGWTLCCRCNDNVDRIRQQCFRSPEQIAEALGWHVNTLQNMSIKRSSVMRSSGWDVKGAYRNRAGNVKLVMTKRGKKKIMRLDHILCLKAAMMDSSFL
jgi:hypothetical protein